MPFCAAAIARPPPIRPRPTTPSSNFILGISFSTKAPAHARALFEPERLAFRLAPNAPTTASRLSRLDGLADMLDRRARSEEHTSELQSLMRISYAVFCLTKKTKEN